MNRSIAGLVRLLIQGAAPATTVALAVMPAAALSAPGDLDPTFGDMGRVAPIEGYAGSAWSAQPLAAGGTLVAGGQGGCDYYCDSFIANSFLVELAGDGHFEQGLRPVKANSQVFDTALLPDGSIIAVGAALDRRSGHPSVVVFKMSSAGVLDEAFGDAGIFTYSGAGNRYKGTSVIVDAAGRIVVAGPHEDGQGMVVLRLLPNGVLDASFGTGGAFTGHAARTSVAGASPESTVHVIAAPTGYRVTTSDCQVLALTADGKLDAGFGSAGVVPLKTASGAAVSCNALAAQPDGRLLAAGTDGTDGFAVRLLASGAIDASFSMDALRGAMNSVTALAVVGDNSGLVNAAGNVFGASNAVVMRLQSSGQADTSYAQAGTAIIDLPSDNGLYPVIHDMSLRADGGLVAVGSYPYPDKPFVVRLLGASGPASSGVLGASQSLVSISEQSKEVVVKFRRTGGSAGSVSVAYHSTSDGFSATAGADYGAVSGHLTWNDGDTSEQEIHVPIVADTITEEDEYFGVTLSEPQGGAGLGTRTATVEIEPDGSPYGQFGFTADSFDATEGATVEVGINRSFYWSGAVSVTVTPTAGPDVAGRGIDLKPVTLSWADGDAETKFIRFSIPEDNNAQPDQTFTVTLSSPTGGALIGPHSSAPVVIAASDQPTPSHGGGGSFGILSLLVMLVMKALHAAGLPRRRVRAPAL